MSIKETYLDKLLPELDAIFERVMKSGRSNSSQLEDDAFALQVGILRQIRTAIGHTLWQEAENKAKRHGLNEESDVEVIYAWALAKWLRRHLEHAVELTTREEDSPANQLARFKENDLKVYRLFAQRHVDAISDFCNKHATALEERVAELKAERSQIATLSLSL